MPPKSAACRPLLVLLAAALLPAAAGAAPPSEGSCPLLGGRPGAPVREDAVPAPIREGLVLHADDVKLLRDLLPRELWRLRDVFFHPGMRMEIGPCHRRYPVASFYAEATKAFASGARVDAEGNLVDHVAGLPFPPESIDAEARDAGARWAWNLEHRYRGAGPSGRFRIVDMPSRDAETFRFEGSFFFLQTQQRADLGESGYAVPGIDGVVWIAGGRFDAPFDARHLAWRQLRPIETQARYAEPDDTFVYVPSMRKLRRASSTWVDGIYTPRYRVGGDGGGGGLAIGGDPTSGPRGAVQPTAARSSLVTESLRAGFTGLALRPNAYVWRVLAEREVLAPINATREGFPVIEERNFGDSGLSVGSDRWDVRYAVVLEGLRREPGGEFQRLELWLDWQTQQPLYVITRNARGRLQDVTILVHRFSGDRKGYPPWPNGERAHVFDPVAAVSYSTLEGGTGWRRESYDVTSLPPDADALRRYTSTDELVKGH